MFQSIGYPVFIYGGCHVVGHSLSLIHIAFSYKNWSLYGRFDYALGHTLYNDLKARTLGQYQGTWNIITDVKDM